MKKILLAIALVLVLAIPASALVKHPAPINVSLYSYYSVDVCSISLQDNRCGTYQCVYEIWPIGCVAATYVAAPMQQMSVLYDYIYHVHQGDTYNVKASMISEVAKDVKWNWMVKLGAETLFKSTKDTWEGFNGEYMFHLGTFKFERPGMHSLIFQVFKPNGTILKATQQIYVYPTTAASPEEERLENLGETSELIIEEVPAEPEIQEEVE